MKRIKININKFYQEEIYLIVDYLKRGQVIVYPTDTIYGLGCSAADKDAINRIYMIKQSPPGKALLLLVSSFAMLKKYCIVSYAQEQYLKKVWPGPVSAVLESKRVLPQELSKNQDSLAVRLPKNKFLITIIKKIGCPIVSTSLNISGRKPVNSPDKLNNYFIANEPDLIIDAGPLSGQKPSQVIDIRDINNIKILRN